jgi:hypothetical protein
MTAPAAAAGHEQLAGGGTSPAGNGLLPAPDTTADGRRRGLAWCRASLSYLAPLITYGLRGEVRGRARL